MEIIEKYLKQSYMTRPKEKLKTVKYIIIHETKYDNAKKEIEYINNLSYQDEVYYSVHYIIDEYGKCVKLVPENEVTYSTNDIELNYNVISVACCINEDGKIHNEKAEDSLVKLLSYLKEKYDLKKSDIVLHYDLTGTRCPKHYVDNRFKFYNILDKVE